MQLYNQIDTVDHCMGAIPSNQPLAQSSAHNMRLTELTGTLSGEQSVWEESVESHNCCGIKYEKVVRRRIIWENNFVGNCEEVREEFPWADDMIELVNNCELTKTRYFREMEGLKEEMGVDEPSSTEVLRSQAEVENFKKNLKKSVILSFGHTPKFFQQPPPNKIVSAITVSRKSRIEITRFSRNINPATMNINYNPSAIRVEKTMSISPQKSFFRKSIMSFVDDTISSILGNEREISKQTAKDLQIFLKFSMILERHMSDINCMLGRIKRLFIVYVEKTYRDPIATSQNIGEFVDNIKQFLMILKEAVIDYYNLGSYAEGEEHVNAFIANDENVLSACTAIVFRDATMYNIVFQAVSAYCKDREERFQRILLKLAGSTPQKFMIKDKFCLNTRTLRSYLNRLSAQSGQQHVENIQISDLMVENLQPYRTCMLHLLDLAKSRSPINKMKAIMACSQGITAQIERFYDMNGLQKEKWMLDADQVLSIFCYVLVGARVEHLHSHLFILDNFATSHQMISMTGYYLSVMNCAVEQIQNQYGREIDEEQL